MTNRTTPENITELQENQIPLIPTNQGGFHGKGLAKTAYEKWGIERGVGEGFSGHCYLLPTKGWRAKTRPWLPIRPLTDIAMSVNRFLNVAKQYPKITFLVPAVGCGLAGYTPEQIAPLFKEAVEIENIHLPASFWEALTKSTP